MWLSELLNSITSKLPSGMDKEEPLHFIVVLREYIWRLRNEIRHGMPLGDWSIHLSEINSSKARQYWNASFNRRAHPSRNYLLTWHSPSAGWEKANVDAIINLDKAFVVCLLCDHLKNTVGTCTSSFQVPDIFAIEAHDSLLACKVGAEEKIKNW